MVNKIFEYNNATGQVELNTPEILLVREFAALMDNERNKCSDDRTGQQKLRAFREFTYIWLALDWRSMYADFTEYERHQEALKDSGITEEEFNDPTFRAACRKYKEILDSNRSIRMMKAALKAVDQFIEYFETIVDLNERDQQGKPIFKTKDVMAEIANLHKVHEELMILESQVKREITESTTVRAGAVDGFTPDF